MSSDEIVIALTAAQAERWPVCPKRFPREGLPASASKAEYGLGELAAILADLPLIEALELGEVWAINVIYKAVLQYRYQLKPSLDDLLS